MSNKSIVTIQYDKKTETHLPHTDGNYATLCGMDGDDDHPAVNQKTLPTTKTKISCYQCKKIFQIASQYSQKDFE